MFVLSSSRLVGLPIYCMYLWIFVHGPLARYATLQVAHAPGITFSPPPRVSDPDMHHGTCVTHVPWCMPGLLTSGFRWSRWRGKRSRCSQRMRNPQFYVSGKRPILWHIMECISSIRASIHQADGRLTARSRKFSKSRDSCLDITNRFEIWQAPRQRGCRDACQISERCDHYNIQSHGFDTSRDLAVRR